MADDLTEEQIKAFRLADNKVGEIAEWDFEMLDLELIDIDMDMTDFGFEFEEDEEQTEVVEDNDLDEQDRIFKERMARGEISEEDEEYSAFLEKFNAKKTTDDCYTPDNIYDVVKKWCIERYGLKGKKIIRPFYPGGDYQKEDYSGDCVVLDNPPFSIISEIISFYNSRGMKFFLFAPALTLLSPACDGYCGIAVGASITYENGAKISTSFATNLESDAAMTSPELYKIITEENKKNERKLHRGLPKYDYPDNVITATFLQKLSKYGINFSVPKNEAIRISALDMQKENKKTIFGKGLLCSDRVSVLKAAAEKINTNIWELSDREREIVKSLGK